MTFNELWTAIEKTGILPKPAIEHIPELLSTESKQQLLEKAPLEAAKMIEKAIQCINNGSTQKIDDLLQNRTITTYKLNPSVRKIKCPVNLCMPDGSIRHYESGEEAADDVFEANYRIMALKAINNEIELTLKPAKVLNTDWIGEENVSFF